MHDRTVKILSRIHTVVYRASGGRVGTRLPRINGSMLLLTTTGRKTGKSHTVPLLYLEADGAWVVIASYGGRPEHPEWYLNLVANPHATVQIDRDRHEVIARTVEGDDRARRWAAAQEAYAGYTAYQSRTGREIPVVTLHPYQPVGG